MKFGRLKITQFAEKKTREKGLAVIKKSLVILLFLSVGMFSIADELEGRVIPEDLAVPEKIRIGRAGLDYEFPKYAWWKKVPGASKYIVEVYDAQSDRRIYSRETARHYVKFPSGMGGPIFDNETKFFFVRVAAISEDSKVGRFSPCGWTYMGGKPTRAAARPKKSQVTVCSNRSPASQLVRTDYLMRNRDYDKSQFQWEGASFLMSTNEITSSTSNFAAAMTTTLRGLYWLGPRWGVEGSFKAKLAGYNDRSSEVNPFQYEGRLHYRWKFPFVWKHWLKEFQVSAFVGYESYANNSTSNSTFIDNYTLTKVGGSIRFPVKRYWDTGGELAVGSAGDGTSKFEIQGYANYYFKEKWSIGTGYRIHMLSAGSLATSPNGILPFRESYGEAYGNIRFSY